MKFNITPTEQHIVLEGKPEIFLAHHVLQTELGNHDPLTERLFKAMKQIIQEGITRPEMSFMEDEQRLIVQGLHNCALGPDSWRQAQAAHMLSRAV